MTAIVPAVLEEHGMTAEERDRGQIASAYIIFHIIIIYIIYTNKYITHATIMNVCTY